MRKNFKAFTLVEMLIVMGIIIILMTVGITAGRYAINRANDVAHQNAVDNIYTAVQAYYADNRQFPAINNFETALDAGQSPLPAFSIAEYMDEGAFDGGTDATYYYDIDTLSQEVLVCVSLFGDITSDQLGEFYCNGNAFGTTSPGIVSIPDKIVERATVDMVAPANGMDLSQNWSNETGWVATPN
jgi:type II secretory pathway pseudopilin PulG